MPESQNVPQRIVQLGASPQRPPAPPPDGDSEVRPGLIFEPQWGTMLIEPQRGILRTQHGQDLADFEFQAHSGETIWATLELNTLDLTVMDQLQNFSNIAVEANVTIMCELNKLTPGE